MKRRDLLKVNVSSTCDDIMDYVLVRVPPLAPNLPRPRFSLYLSSQLQFGVVFVFHRQCQLLLEEIQQAIDRLQRCRIKLRIDMRPEELRQTHSLPDALTLLNESEGAMEPFFGLMEFHLPSPSRFLQNPAQCHDPNPAGAQTTGGDPGAWRIWRLAEGMEAAPPEPSPPLKDITASQEQITMAEREPVAVPEPEFEGQELQELDMLDMLLDQLDHFPEGEAAQVSERAGERKEGTVEREPEREREAKEVERVTELTGSTISVEPAPSRERVSLPEEDLELPAQMPEPAERERTPEPVPVPPSPLSPERSPRPSEGPPAPPELRPSSPEPPVQPGARRRRQLIFIDQETQISQEALQAQISNTRTETRSLKDIFRADVDLSSPKSLLTNPCMSLPPDILRLWRQGAVLHRVPPPRRAREEEREVVPERERGREELDEGELREETVESGFLRHDTPVPSLVMEITDRDISPLETPEARRSPVPVVSVSVPGLEDISEERVPELEDVTMDADDPLRRLEDTQQVTFHSLLPPMVRRRTVIKAFWRLLERIDMREVTVQQDQPYGDIIISLSQQPLSIRTELD